jgi:hypothetical protein
VSPVKYELGFYIPEDDILHSHRRENLKSYVLFSRFFLLQQIPDTRCEVIAICGPGSVAPEARDW